MNTIPGQQLVGGRFKDPRGPFLRKHALYSAKGVIVKEKHPLGRLGLSYKKNYKKLNDFESF